MWTYTETEDAHRAEITERCRGENNQLSPIYHQTVEEMAFEFGQIGNMDETAMTFDMAGFRPVIVSVITYTVRV